MASRKRQLDHAKRQLDHAKKAIEVFEASLITPDSPFDRFLERAGDADPLSGRPKRVPRPFIGGDRASVAGAKVSRYRVSACN